MTATEREVLELAIQLECARYAVEEAIIRQQYKRAVRLLIKERRDAKAEKDSATKTSR